MASKRITTKQHPAVDELQRVARNMEDNANKAVKDNPVSYHIRFESLYNSNEGSYPPKMSDVLSISLTIPDVSIALLLFEDTFTSLFAEKAVEAAKIIHQRLNSK